MDQLYGSKTKLCDNRYPIYQILQHFVKKNKELQ